MFSVKIEKSAVLAYVHDADMFAFDVDLEIVEDHHRTNGAGWAAIRTPW
jgi:hypothetical protein